MDNDPTPSPEAEHRLSTSRIALYASVAAIAVVALVAGFHDRSSPSPFSSAPASAAVTVATPGQPSGFADLVSKVRPAVISVRVQIQETTMDDDGIAQPDNPLSRFFGSGAPDSPNPPQRHQTVVGEGSGFFISADGYAVTNNHVVDHTKALQVTTDDGSAYKAHVIGTDPGTDLALIKVDGGSSFTYVKFADQAPRVGDWVVAIGNPYGLGNTVTAGIVSALGRDIGESPYDSFIQIDAPINRGNSGGPTFDLSGNVVGINSVIVSPSGGSVGIGFDIPADTAKTITATLLKTGHVSRGWLGVQIQDLTRAIAESLGLKHAAGALVAATESGSPAAKAGLQAGDIVTAVNGTPVNDGRTLAQEIATLAPGGSVKLSVMRRAKTDTLTLKLGEMPDRQQAPPA